MACYFNSDQDTFVYSYILGSWCHLSQLAKQYLTVIPDNYSLNYSVFCIRGSQYYFVINRKDVHNLWFQVTWEIVSLII